MSVPYRNGLVASRKFGWLVWLAMLMLWPAVQAGAQQGGSSASTGFGMGLTQLQQSDGGWVTVFYPAMGQETPVLRGPFRLLLIPDGVPVTGNSHLVVISHGSGGSPWVHADLARTLVRRGFTVALPLHRGDNDLDPSEPGPASWRRRPQEVSDALDLVARHAVLAPSLDLSSVGVLGGSAGGHTALSLAGGRWSDARFRDHCEQHLDEDFSSCVGFITLLRGNVLDGLKRWAARLVIGWRFSDETWHEYRDPRIKAALAMVPFAADFQPASLQHPQIPLGLVLAGKDRNQIPRFHVQVILEACAPECELVMELPEAGHGVMLSPAPPLNADTVAAYLLSDPPGFQRERDIPELNSRIAAFFERHLLVQPSASVAAMGQVLTESKGPMAVGP